ncbi:lysozyme inhibitor LprI family protein [soil metagenome]
MKNLKYILTMIAAAAFNLPVAAQNCKNPDTQLAMNICSGKDYEREDARLNKNYRDLVAKLEKAERDKLRDLQLAWLKFRDLQCDFQSMQYEGGTMYSLVRSMCLTGLTKQRNKDLKDLLEEASM